MNRDLIPGHLDGAAYVYDRAAYKIYREMTDAAEQQHKKDVKDHLRNIGRAQALTKIWWL